jgi:hypothetical protein
MSEERKSLFRQVFKSYVWERPLPITTLFGIAASYVSTVLHGFVVEPAQFSRCGANV